MWLNSSQKWIFFYWLKANVCIWVCKNTHTNRGRGRRSDIGRLTHGSCYLTIYKQNIDYYVVCELFAYSIHHLLSLFVVQCSMFVSSQLSLLSILVFNWQCDITLRCQCYEQQRIIYREHAIKYNTHCTLNNTLE